MNGLVSMLGVITFNVLQKAPFILSLPYISKQMVVLRVTETKQKKITVGADVCLLCASEETKIEDSCNIKLVFKKHGCSDDVIMILFLCRIK